MFTSRAEHRLLLREDNADARLTPRGRGLGLVDDERWALFEAKQQAIASELARLTARRFKPAQIPADWARRVLGTAAPARDVTALELLRRPEVGFQELTELDPELAIRPLPDDRLVAQVQRDLSVQASYAGYIERAQQEIERASTQEHTPLPEDLDYAALGGLSNEVRQQLAAVRPATLGQAARVPGVTPAAVSILLVHLRRRGARVA
jgi:tRNA uridine 5-carboxymethylaminomethyl modification enzyme